MLQVPKFKTEAEEAQWWFDNQDLLAEAFDAAAGKGTLRRSTLADRLARAKAAQVPIALDAADVTLARELAMKSGEGYQALLRRVVHEALELEKTA